MIVELHGIWNTYSEEFFQEKIASHEMLNTFAFDSNKLQIMKLKK